MLSSDFSLTKRHIGLLIVFTGAIALVGACLYGSDGFGSAQKLAIIAAICLIGIGLSLLPLGDQPA